MKAYVLHQVNDLRREERPRPELLPGWVLVRVLAAGICSSDIPRIFEKGTYRFPTIPGHEFCGVVAEAGGPEGQSWVGRRVGVYPLIPCRECPSCASGSFETCENYDYIGSRRDGGFAEFTAVPVRNLIALPEAVSNAGGAMLEPAAVALHGVRRLGDLTGKTVCVAGTGTIGLLAGQWARLLGAAQVTVLGRNQQKKDWAEACGLDYVTQTGEVFDRVIEAVGTPAAIESAIRLTAPGGGLTLMGNPPGAIPLSQEVYWRILRKQLTLTGSWNSAFWGEDSDWERTVQALAEGRLKTAPLVTHTLEPEGLLRGLELMRNKTEPYCKVIWEGGAS